MLAFILGALVVSARRGGGGDSEDKVDMSCACTQDNKGLPGKNGLNEDMGIYCKAWDMDEEYCKGDKYEKWCEEKWCYVDKACEFAEPTNLSNKTELYWAYGVCEGEPATCMAYSKPRPKIKPCPDSNNKQCDGKKRSQCNNEDCCMWDKKEKSCVSNGQCDDEGCKTCDKCKQAVPSVPTVKNNLPWGGTQSPDYWYNCIARWCSKYTWMGGPEQCHYETKYGCGCESMKYEECLENSEECCWSGKESGCQEKVECPRLTFSECLNYPDKCSPCGSGGCSYNCEMGPGQELSGFQSLVLDCNCNCQVTQMF